MAKPTRPSSPGGGSAGDPSRLNRGAARRSSLRFGRNTLRGPVLPVGAPPSRASSRAPHRPRRSRGFHHRLLTADAVEILWEIRLRFGPLPKFASRGSGQAQRDHAGPRGTAGTAGTMVEGLAGDRNKARVAVGWLGRGCRDRLHLQTGRARGSGMGGFRDGRSPVGGCVDEAAGKSRGESKTRLAPP